MTLLNLKKTSQGRRNQTLQHVKTPPVYEEPVRHRHLFISPKFCFEILPFCLKGSNSAACHRPVTRERGGVRKRRQGSRRVRSRGLAEISVSRASQTKNKTTNPAPPGAWGAAAHEAPVGKGPGCRQARQEPEPPVALRGRPSTLSLCRGRGFLGQWPIGAGAQASDPVDSEGGRLCFCSGQRGCWGR